MNIKTERGREWKEMGEIEEKKTAKRKKKSSRRLDISFLRTYFKPCRIFWIFSCYFISVLSSQHSPLFYFFCVSFCIIHPQSPIKTELLWTGFCYVDWSNLHLHYMLDKPQVLPAALKPMHYPKYEMDKDCLVIFICEVFKCKISFFKVSRRYICFYWVNNTW